MGKSREGEKSGFKDDLDRLYDGDSVWGLGLAKNVNLEACPGSAACIQLTGEGLWGKLYQPQLGWPQEVSETQQRYLLIDAGATIKMAHASHKGAIPRTCACDSRC